MSARDEGSRYAIFIRIEDGCPAEASVVVLQRITCLGHARRPLHARLESRRTAQYRARRYSIGSAYRRLLLRRRRRRVAECVALSACGNHHSPGRSVCAATGSAEIDSADLKAARLGGLSSV